MIFSRWRVLVLLMGLIFGSLLAACGNSEERPLPTLIPTSTPPPATETAPPTIAPTFTPLPTVAVEIIATALPFPTITAVPTSTPLPGLFLTTPEDFGPDRNPLTGEIVAESANLQRRPLAIKVSNSPPQYARPQYGLSQADLVFEHVTETDITRFTAIFYSETPPDIGPVRSARLIDKELPAMYDAALAMSGAHPVVSQRLHGSDIGDRILRSHESGFYRTGEDKPWEHTLHADPAGLWQAIAAHEEDRPPQFTAWMTFATIPPAGGEAANRITVAYDIYTIVEWVFDAANGRYYRWSDGEATIDANNGKQISAANVILLTAIHEKDRSICLTHSEGVCSDWPIEIQIWGQGEGVLLRDGKQYPITWLRENRSDFFTFVDANGEPVPLQIGNSWFQILPHYYENPVTITN